jgi:hypothetical protein
MANKNPAVSQNPAPGPAPDPKDNDPKYFLIIVGDDGNLYKLTRGQWMQNPLLPTDPAAGVAGQLKEYGTYLAYVRTDIAVGAGYACTLVNLNAVLKNNV